MTNPSAEEAKAAEAAQDALQPRDDSPPTYTQAAPATNQQRNGSLPDYAHAVLDSPPTVQPPSRAVTVPIPTTQNPPHSTSPPRNEVLPDYAQAMIDPPPRAPRPSKPPTERSEAYMEALKAWAAERETMRMGAYGTYFADIPEKEDAQKKKKGPTRLGSFMNKLKHRGKSDDGQEESATQARLSVPEGDEDDEMALPI